MSPIVYSLKTYACLKAKNAQGLYSSNQLYTPALSQAYEAFPFPIADIPENIPNEIVQALGFKFALTFEEAMTLLENEPHLNPKKLQFLYRSLLSTYEKTSPTHQDRIEAFGKNKPFLSTQGTYKKHAEIYCWDMPGQPSTETYSFIDPCGLSLEDLQYLAQMFKLKLFSRDTLNTLTTLSLEQPQEAAKICQDLKLKVLHFLHIATISVAIDNGIHTANIDKIAKNFYDKLQGLTLTCWGDLCFALEHLSVSDSEFAKEKVVVKDHEILFTKQAYDNESVSLIDALANRMFDSEELKKLFAAYMDKPRRIRQQNLAMKNRSSADILAQAEAFFSSRASVYSQNISQSHSLAPEAQPLASAFAGFSITPRQTEPLADTGQARRREGIGELPTLWNVSRPYAPAPLTVDQPAGSSMKDIEKTAKNINTGQQGELRFYQYLQEQTQKMFPSSQAEETAEGYAVYDSNHRPIINIIWFNKNGEQRKAMDFQVDYQGQSYIFEVKTTQGQDMHAFISSSEVKKLDEYKDNYALVFVFGDGNIHIRWNPSQKISNRILELIPTQYQLFIDTSHDLEWAREEQHKDKGCRMS